MFRCYYCRGTQSTCCAPPGQVFLDEERSYKQTNLGVESFEGLGKTGSEVIHQLATSVFVKDDKNQSVEKKIRERTPRANYICRHAGGYLPCS